VFVGHGWVTQFAVSRYVGLKGYCMFAVAPVSSKDASQSEMRWFRSKRVYVHRK
jgi:hypothetical protein